MNPYGSLGSIVRDTDGLGVFSRSKKREEVKENEAAFKILANAA